jgi:hypothetical protein
VEDPPWQELVAGPAADRWISLSQSGEPGDAKMRLDDVALDLPAVVEAGAGRRSGLSVTSSNAVMPYSHRNNQIEWVRPVVVVGESEEWVIQGPYMQQASDGWFISCPPLIAAGGSCCRPRR